MRLAPPLFSLAPADCLHAVLSDCCALSLQPFSNPVAVVSPPTPTVPQAHADVFELLNIVPYIRKYHTSPVSGDKLETTDLIKLNFFKVGQGGSGRGGGCSADALVCAG